MRYLMPALLLGLLWQVPAAPVDPGIQALVDRFFETQQGEDAAGYLALWSSKAARPQPQQLRFIFESGDDRFLDITIARASIAGETARVRVSATRVRTDLRLKNPDGSPRLLSSRLHLALALVREDGAWRIVREGAPVDELAAALIDAADEGARRALLDSEPELVTLRLFEALGRRADAHVQKSEYRQAQPIYERSLEVARVIKDAKAEGQALGNIANSLYYQRNFPAALALYERRLVLEREQAHDEGVANALLGVATIRYSTFEFGQALESYREALAIQERLQDDLLISTTLVSTGNVLFLQGDFEAAIADYRRAEVLKRKYFDLAGAASALEGLGRVFTAQGDYASALSAFAGVADERRKQNDVPRLAFVIQSIGEIHLRLGNTDLARSSFEEARKHFESVKEIGHAGRVLQGTALNELVVGRFPAAEKAYSESISMCTTASDAECIARAQVGLGFALAAQQQYDPAIAWYRKSLVSFEALELKDAAARARVGLAAALYGKTDYAASLDEAVSARRDGVALASDDLLWRALVSVARAERKLGRRDAAFGSAKAAVQAVERMASVALDRPGESISRDTANAFALMAVMQVEAGDPSGAAVTAERMRAHALRLVLAPHERDIARGMTDEERRDERALASELTTLIVKRARQKDLPNPDAARIKALEASIGEAAARRSSARGKLFARLPELEIWRGLGRAVSADDLPALFDEPGQVLLQFVVDDHDLVVLTARRPKPDGALEMAAHVVSIERQALADRIARAMDGKALASVATWRTESAPVFALLPAAVVEQLTSASSVIVIPDDVLWRAPWEAMPVADLFLADRAVVTYAASLAASVLAPRSAPIDAKAPLRAVHSPEVPPAVLESLKLTAPSWVIRSAEPAAAEMAAIVKAAGEPAPTVLSGRQATKSALAGLASGDVPWGPLHLAVPFRVNSASPMFSGMLLGPGSAPGSAESFELEARELFLLPALASAVTLSDPAALSRRDGAASIVPVYWAWRANGADTLMVRRWAGDEAASAELISRFYAELRAGKDPALALHAARLALRAANPGLPPAAWAVWGQISVFQVDRPIQVANAKNRD